MTNQLKVNNRNLTLLLADSLSAIQQRLHSITREHMYMTLTATCPNRSPEHTAPAENPSPSSALANGPTYAAC